MKTIITRLALCAMLALIATHSNPANAQSQSEMNRKAAQEFETADATLNKVFKQLIGKLDAEGKEKLKNAQRAWVQFRDAQADFEADKEARGGSLAPLISNGARKTLTDARIKELQLVLKEQQ